MSSATSTPGSWEVSASVQKWGIWEPCFECCGEKLESRAVSGGRTQGQLNWGSSFPLDFDSIRCSNGEISMVPQGNV